MDADEIITRQTSLTKEMIKEMKISKSVRTDVLLITNHIEFVLADFMELLLGTEKAREVRRGLIVDILEDMGILTKDFAYDIRQIFQIRDAYAHKLSLNQIHDFIEKRHLPNLKCIKQNPTKFLNWEEKSLNEKITHVSEWISTELLMRFYEIAFKHIDLS